MLSLIIESCTERSLVALVHDNVCLYASGIPFGLHNSKYLLPKIEEGFHLINKNPQELDFITTGIGPGSYTGMRVGAVIAKTLSYSHKIPLVGICTLQGFLPDRKGDFAALIDAKMGGVYFMKGNKNGTVIHYNSGPETCALDCFEENLKEIPLFVGPSLESLRKKIEILLPNRSWEWQETAADPCHLMNLAAQKFLNKEYSVDGTLQLLYMKEP